ncbi:hypothetical protein HY988_01940 [Candidatus Micrarchaeota archaeon]|nr:hypothetical protein [Candidatus Micrarchaeota archaeon]
MEALIKPELFDATAALFIISFIFWEAPRSIKKLISEEYTDGVYPATGRVVDFFLLAVGLSAFIYLKWSDHMQRVLFFLISPGVSFIFLIVIITLPLIILLGFFKRFFARMEGHNSITIFLVQGLLDFSHTVFFITFSLLVIPVLEYLILGKIL